MQCYHRLTLKDCMSERRQALCMRARRCAPSAEVPSLARTSDCSSSRSSVMGAGSCGTRPAQHDDQPKVIYNLTAFNATFREQKKTVHWISGKAVFLSRFIHIVMVSTGFCSREDEGCVINEHKELRITVNWTRAALKETAR